MSRLVFVTVMRNSSAAQPRNVQDYSERNWTGCGGGRSRRLSCLRKALRDSNLNGRPSDGRERGCALGPTTSHPTCRWWTSLDFARASS